MAKKRTVCDVFLVEDDPFLYKVLQQRLEQEGICVKVATDGEMALANIEAANPRLILLDLILPKKSGFEVLVELRKMPRLKQCPVLILSNLGHQDDITQMSKYGVREYLVKADYSLSEIVEKVQEHLKKT